MTLLDSNIVIYAAQPEHAFLRELISIQVVAVSAVTMVEVLGYHRLTSKERQLFEAFFQTLEVLPISDAVIQQAIVLRQQRRMTLGDALIAGTATVHQLALATHNTQDFKWIPNLDVYDPFEEG